MNYLMISLVKWKDEMVSLKAKSTEPSISGPCLSESCIKIKIN